MAGPVTRLAAPLALAVACSFPAGAFAFIDSPHHPVERYTLPAMLRNSWVAVLRVDRLGLDRGGASHPDRRLGPERCGRPRTLSPRRLSDTGWKAALARMGNPLAPGGGAVFDPSELRRQVNDYPTEQPTT